MNRKQIILLVCLAVLIAVIPTYVYADVGGGTDWDNDNWGGGNNYGGGGGGSSTFGINPFMLFYLIRYVPRPVLIIGVVIFFLTRTFQKKNRQNTYQKPAAPIHSEPSGSRDLSRLKERDPNFSESTFEAMASHVFVELQHAWTNKDWKSIRTFESNVLFAQHNTQLNEMIQKGQTNVVEEISVVSTEIEAYDENSSHQILHALINARYRDYLVDDRTGDVLKGDPKKKYLMTYRMTFTRMLDAKTSESTETEVTACPNCGANLSINQHGICDYCGSEVTKGAERWMLTKLEPIRQQLV